nr:TATA box-binding protein-associated factor, RNA polymerase I, subunit C-like [Nerophis lumbriciformis]
MTEEKCHQVYRSRPLQAFSALLSDVVQTVPPELLGSLLYEELMAQRDRHLFFEGATGGALNFIPFSQGRDSQNGCLLYPGKRGMNHLNFHRVEFEQHQDKCFSVNSESKPFSFQLKGPIRQISSASLFNISCVSLRSDYCCGVWRFSETEEPRLLQVVNTAEVATCVNVSPHVLGEILVASKSGKTHLWTVGKGIQKVWEDDSNLYFNAKSSWRWCEFSAHPRVMVYADRTGAELCDIRTSPASNHTLFRISSTAECRRGERLILCKYLTDPHPFHHLVTTQYSAYIMDERLPSLPMLKIDHMMQSPPVFCHVLPGVSSSCGDARSTKILLGSQRSQEITQLQYSGSRSEAYVSLGPPQALLRPCDSLKHLPVHIPHRMDTASTRLSSPSAGLTCIQKSARDGSNESICVLQLTEAGDIFCQVLEHKPLDDTSENEAPSSNASKNLLQPTHEHVSSSDEEDEKVTNSLASDAEQPCSAQKTPTIMTHAKLSENALATWKLWLQKLFLKSRKKKPRPRSPKQFTVNTSGLLCLSSDKVRELSEEEHVMSMRQQLSECMSNRSLLVRRTGSSEPSDVVPFPDEVDTAAFTDDLSQRLTLSWHSQDNWREWWNYRLGLSKEEKMKALRRKRRKEKAARSGGRRLDLSDSFSSSVTNLSELDSFSDFSGWSSSEGRLSEGNETSQSEGTLGCETSRAKTPTSVLSEDSAAHVPVTQATTVQIDSTPSSQKKNKRPADNYLSSLFGSQNDNSQLDNCFDAEEHSLRPVAHSSQQYGSQSLSLSQGSVRRPGSQSSQPKKKKARMGF